MSLIRKSHKFRIDEISKLYERSYVLGTNLAMFNGKFLCSGGIYVFDGTSEIRVCDTFGEIFDYVISRIKPIEVDMNKYRTEIYARCDCLNKYDIQFILDHHNETPRLADLPVKNIMELKTGCCIDYGLLFKFVFDRSNKNPDLTCYVVHVKNHCLNVITDRNGKTAIADCGNGFMSDKMNDILKHLRYFEIDSR